LRPFFIGEPAVKKSALTQERLQEVLHYDPGSGEFRWRMQEDLNRRVGDIAGCSMRSDYWCIHVDGRSYRAHQLAWLYMTGEWGRPLIAHRDGDPFNNRWRNLRLSNCLHCAAPRGPRRSTASAFTGIALDRRSGQWTARIGNGERGYLLGRFPTNEAAHEAYAMAARLLQQDFRSG
jgi:HNH endonuclease